MGAGAEAFPEQRLSCSVSWSTRWVTGVPKGFPPTCMEGAVQMPSFSAGP